MINIKYKKNPLLGSGYLDCGFEPLDSLLLYSLSSLILLLSRPSIPRYYISLHTIQYLSVLQMIS